MLTLENFKEWHNSLEELPYDHELVLCGCLDGKDRLLYLHYNFDTCASAWYTPEECYYTSVYSVSRWARIPKEMLNDIEDEE